MAQNTKLDVIKIMKIIVIITSCILILLNTYLFIYSFAFSYLFYAVMCLGLTITVYSTIPKKNKKEKVVEENIK